MTLDNSERLPSLFGILDANLLCKCKWVRERSYGYIATDRVLAQIDGSLGRVPFKPRRHTQMLLHYSSYINMAVEGAVRSADDYGIPDKGSFRESNGVHTVGKSAP
jgi:hypothetical protein